MALYVIKVSTYAYILSHACMVVFLSTTTWASLIAYYLEKIYSTASSVGSSNPPCSGDATLPKILACPTSTSVNDSGGTSDHDIIGFVHVDAISATIGAIDGASATAYGGGTCNIPPITTFSL